VAPEAAAATPDPPVQPSPEPLTQATIPDHRSTAIGRAWDWCRRYPAPVTVLTAAAACLLLGMFAAEFAGRANSTALPTGDSADEFRDALRQTQERAERAERDMAAARTRADSLAAAR